MSKFELFYPVKPLHFNQKFGENPQIYTQAIYGGIKGHNGIDFQASHGQPVYAAHDGICYPEIDSAGGNGVVIRALIDNDYQGKQVRFKTIYWHLIQDDAVVKTGQQVKAGDLIGYADSTGASTGDHLHFGLKAQEWNETDWAWYNTEQSNGYNGAIDPMPYFNGYFAQDAQTVLGIYQKVISLLKNYLNK